MFASDCPQGTVQKVIAMFFFRKAHDLYRMQVPRELSPSFWDSEARDPADWEGFPAVLPGIEHELGTGHTTSFYAAEMNPKCLPICRASSVYNRRHRKRGPIFSRAAARGRKFQLLFA